MPFEKSRAGGFRPADGAGLAEPLLPIGDGGHGRVTERFRHMAQRHVEEPGTVAAERRHVEGVPDGREAIAQIDVEFAPPVAGEADVLQTHERPLEVAIGPSLPAGTELLHVGDMVSAKDALYNQHWDLLLLDVSLDINPGGGDRRAGKEFTGGVTLASRMRYRRKEVPTIVVTGFTTFLSVKPENELDVVLGLQDVEREMRRFLKEHVVGVVRYGADGWKDELTEYVRRTLER